MAERAKPEAEATESAAEAQGAQCRARMRTDVWSRWRVCGRPVKGALADGTPVCGIHLAVERQRTESKNEHDRQRALQDRLFEAAKAACLDLADAGIYAKPEYQNTPSGGARGYTGLVVASPSEILEAISARTSGIQVSEGRDGSGD